MFGIVQLMHGLVHRRINVAGTTLHKKSHHIFAQILLDRFRRKAWKISRVTATWHCMNRMASKIVEQGERRAVGAIET